MRKHLPTIYLLGWAFLVFSPKIAIAQSQIVPQQVTVLIDQVNKEFPGRTPSPTGPTVQKLEREIKFLCEQRNSPILLALINSHSSNESARRKISLSIIAFDWKLGDLEFITAFFMASLNWPDDLESGRSWPFPRIVQDELAGRLFYLLNERSLTKETDDHQQVATNPLGWIESLLTKANGRFDPKTNASITRALHKITAQRSVNGDVPALPSPPKTLSLILDEPIRPDSNPTPKHAGLPKASDQAPSPLVSVTQIVCVAAVIGLAVIAARQCHKPS